MDIGEIEKQVNCLRDHRDFCSQCPVLTDDIEKSLRLVPKLIALRDVCAEVRAMIGEKGFMEVGDDLSCSSWLALYARFKAALAALDAGEGVK